VEGARGVRGGGAAGEGHPHSSRHRSEGGCTTSSRQQGEGGQGRGGGRGDGREQWVSPVYKMS